MLYFVLLIVFYLVVYPSFPSVGIIRDVSLVITPAGANVSKVQMVTLLGRVVARVLVTWHS